jgi:hypothetical protein
MTLPVTTYEDPVPPQAGRQVARPATFGPMRSIDRSLACLCLFQREMLQTNTSASVGTDAELSLSLSTRAPLRSAPLCPALLSVVRSFDRGNESCQTLPVERRKGNGTVRMKYRTGKGDPHNSSPRRLLWNVVQVRFSSSKIVFCDIICNKCTLKCIATGVWQLFKISPGRDPFFFPESKPIRRAISCCTSKYERGTARSRCGSLLGVGGAYGVDTLFRLVSVVTRRRGDKPPISPFTLDDKKRGASERERERERERGRRWAVGWGLWHLSLPPLDRQG